MQIGEWTRGLVYWGRDTLRGGRVHRHVQELDQAFTVPSAAIDTAQRRCRDLIEHACNTTGYYRQFRGARELAEFPILQKATIRKHYREFLSSAYDQRSLVGVVTSGSYGTPFTFYLSPDKKARHTAEVIYFGGWSGYRVGRKHAYVKVTSVKDKLTLFMQNEVLMNPAVLSETWLETQRQILRKERIPLIIGYASSISALAEYCRAQGDRPESFCVEAIIPNSEPLHETARATLHEVFDCPVMSRYATEEMGVLAQQCKQEGHHHLNMASYIVELVSPERDEPVEQGQVGRIIVTDLFSHAMPLIRYDLGDLAVAGHACPCGRPGPTLERIEGRVVEEVLATDGERLSPYAINVPMRDIDGVIQFQFVQLGARQYEMRLCTLPSFSQQELVRQRLLKILGADAELRLSQVEQIPALPSGKRPYIINEWHRRLGAEQEDARG